MENEFQPEQDAARSAEDIATFGMEKAATQGEVSVEFTRSNSRKMLLVWALVFVISVVLLFCIGAGVIGLIVWTKLPRTTPAEMAKKELAAPKEMKARIKTIDRGQRTMRLLVGDGKYQTFRIDAATEFRDEAGQRLPQGFDAPQLREEEMVTILPTNDRQGLQWLKLGVAK